MAAAIEERLRLEQAEAMLAAMKIRVDMLSLRLSQVEMEIAELMGPQDIAIPDAPPVAAQKRRGRPPKIRLNAAIEGSDA